MIKQCLLLPSGDTHCTNYGNLGKISKLHYWEMCIIDTKCNNNFDYVTMYTLLP